MTEHKTVYLPQESERYQAIAAEKWNQRREAARLFEMAYRLDAEAVKFHHEADRIRARAAARGLMPGSAACCANPSLAWDGPINNAVVRCGSCGFTLSDDGLLGNWWGLGD